VKKHPTSNTEHRTPNTEHRTSDSPASASRRFDLEDRLLEFSAGIIALVDGLKATRSANHVGGQLLRSGTSPYLHHGEVESAESRADFIHKLKVCLKELRETWRGLRLVGRAKLACNPSEAELLFNECEQLVRIFVTSVRTTTAREPGSASVREDAPTGKHSMFDVRCSMFDVQRWLRSDDPSETLIALVAQ
jgi:four helix bundle protein